MLRKILFAVALVAICMQAEVQACTNFLITKGASADGSTMVTYAADSHQLYGCLYHRKAGKYPAGTMMKVYEWDTGKYLGEIEQAMRQISQNGNPRIIFTHFALSVSKQINRLK